MRTLALAAALVAAPAFAQADPVEHLAGVLALTDDQADLVAEVYDDRDPSSTWTLAAELVPTLTDVQREALFARPERPEGARRGGQGRRGNRAARGGARAERDPAQVAVQRAARNAALGLDDAQSADLDEALESLRGMRGLRAMRDGTVPEEVSAVLTEDQIDLWRAHTALRMRLRLAGRATPEQ
ncbi:MAG: hypothetical protein AAF845_19525 [Bacteroidota bacterium]